MKMDKFPGALFVIFHLISCPLAAAPDTEGVFSTYTDSVGLVAMLSSEESIAFRYAGYASNRRSGHASSVSRFPKVQSCLDRTELDRQRPDLTNFNWENIDTDADAEVCIFRVAASYANPLDMKSWFDSQGFTSTIVTTKSESKILVDGNWSVDQDGARYDSGFLNRIGIEFWTHSIDVRVEYDNENMILGVALMHIVL